MSETSINLNNQEHSRYLYCAIQKVYQKLAHYFDPKQYPLIKNLTTDQSTLRSDSKTVPALKKLSDAFNLSQLEQEILVLCAGYELNPHFANLIAGINQNPSVAYPTLHLVSQVFFRAFLL